MQLWFRTLLRNSFFQVGIGILIIMVFGGIVLKLLETGDIIEGENPFWWAIVTMTTVGYGDFAPVTTAGRVFSIVVMFGGISLISLLTATISSIFVAKKIREGKGLEKINVTNHVIICGWNKHGRRIIRTIDNLAHGEKEIVLINDLSEEKVTALRSRFRQIKLYFVSGDFTRENILERASIRDSQTVVVIPNETDTILSSPDEKTIFATMTIKSIDPNIRVVAYLMDKENLTHMKRTNVDEVVVSDDFGAYMVASHVIETGVPQTISHLLDETAASRFVCRKIPKDFIGRPFSALSDHFRNEGGLILVGVFSIEENLGINSILSADSSSLDAFIEHKLKEGGISLQEAEKVSTVINPHEEYLISDGEQAVVIS